MEEEENTSVTVEKGVDSSQYNCRFHEQGLFRRYVIWCNFLFKAAAENPILYTIAEGRLRSPVTHYKDALFVRNPHKFFFFLLQLHCLLPTASVFTHLLFCTPFTWVVKHTFIFWGKINSTWPTHFDLNTVLRQNLTMQFRLSKIQVVYFFIAHIYGITNTI